MVKVSVIVPIFNICEPILRQCLESLTNQSYRELEIILVNDGSTNNCVEICMEYYEDSRIVVINKENGGVSSARNLGIQKSSGEYILFVDADDILTWNAIQIMVSEIERSGADILICGYKRFVKYNHKLEIMSDCWETKIYEDGSDLIKLRKKCLHEDNSLNIRFNGAPWGKIYSSKVIKNNNLLFDTTLIRSQDNYFNFLLFGQAKKIGYINLPLYLYRYTPTSSVNRFRDNLFEISQRYLSCVINKIYSEERVLDFSDLIIQIKVEKFSEYINTYFAHPQNSISLKEKISQLKCVEKEWINPNDQRKIIDHFDSYRSKILYKLIFSHKYTLAYYYIKLLRKLKSFILKFS